MIFLMVFAISFGGLVQIVPLFFQLNRGVRAQALYRFGGFGLEEQRYDLNQATE